MLKLLKNDALSIGRLAKLAKKKIPLYEENKSEYVKVPFLDVKAKKERYLHFFKRKNGWHYFEIVD